MAESELIALVKELDRCWTERRFDDLRRCLAEDAVFVAPDGRARVEGREAAIEGYREFMARARVDRFEARDHVATERGDAGVVEYRWSIVWEGGGERREDEGREVLVLARRDGAWRVVWRMPLLGAG